MLFAAVETLLDEVAPELHPDLRVAARRVGTDDAGLYPVEAAAMARAIPSRRAEFAAGRNAARQALVALGVAPCAIPAGEDRAPVWPKGITGSIAHSASAALGAAAPSTRLRSIGIDIEPHEPVDTPLVPEICFDGEVSAFAEPEAVAARRIFSAKEAAYKAQYPLSKAIFGFDGLRVAAGPSGRLVLRFVHAVPPFDRDQTLTVQQWARHGAILSLCQIEPEARK